MPESNRDVRRSFTSPQTHGVMSEQSRQRAHTGPHDWRELGRRVLNEASRLAQDAVQRTRVATDGVEAETPHASHDALDSALVARRRTSAQGGAE